MTRPDFCTDDMLDFLDKRAESFRMEMWDDIMLGEEFPGLTVEQCREVVKYWRDTEDSDE